MADSVFVSVSGDMATVTVADPALVARVAADLVGAAGRHAVSSADGMRFTVPVAAAVAAGYWRTPLSRRPHRVTLPAR